MVGAKGIRGRVAALGRRGRGAKLPEDLREEIADYARGRRERGGRVCDIAEEVGVSRESIRRWSSTSGGGRTTALPVRVRPDDAATHLVVVTPGGVRIEGLDLEQAAEVWDGTGLCIYQKRLEQGRFAALWKRERSGMVELTMSELALFLEGSRAMERMKLSPARFLLGPVRAKVRARS